MKMEVLRHIYDPDEFRRQGHQLVDLLADYLTGQLTSADEKVLDFVPPDELLAQWHSDGSDSPNAIFSKIIRQSIHLHNPGYMGHQVAPPAPLSALAGWLGLFLNNGGAIYEMAPATSALERWVIETFRGYFGLHEAEGVLTSGGTLANLTAMLCARNCMMQGNVWQEGHTEKVAFMVSEEAHYCIDRAVRIMGWGSTGIVTVPVDDQFRMRTDLLQEMYDRTSSVGIRIIGVVGSAPSTSTGKYDDLSAIGQFCRRHGLWFHIDAAHGGPAAFSKTYSHLMEGAAFADSLVVDAHKMMMVPALTTILFFRTPSDSYRTFAQKAHYLWSKADDEWYNYGKRTMECTKLMMSARIYALWKTYGMEAFEECTNVTYGLARQMAEYIDLHPSLEIAVQPDSNIVCFRYIDCPLEQRDELHRRIRQTLLVKGQFYIVQTLLRGEVWLRVSLMNPFTTMEHIKIMLEQVCLEGQSLLADKPQQL